MNTKDLSNGNNKTTTKRMKRICGLTFIFFSLSQTFALEKTVTEEGNTLHYSIKAELSEENYTLKDELIGPANIIQDSFQIELSENRQRSGSVQTDKNIQGTIRKTSTTNKTGTLLIKYNAIKNDQHQQNNIRPTTSTNTTTRDKKIPTEHTVKDAIYINFRESIDEQTKKEITETLNTSFEKPFEIFGRDKLYRIQFSLSEHSQTSLVKKIQDKRGYLGAKPELIPLFSSTTQKETTKQEEKSTTKDPLEKKQRYKEQLKRDSIQHCPEPEHQAPHIVVIDNAFEHQHEDFSTDIQTFDASSKDNDPTPPIIDELRNHGTIAMGIIGAEKNKKGIFGLSPPQSKKTFIKATQDRASGSDITNGLEALAKAAEAGADIINISRGIQYDADILHKVIKQLHKKDITIVAAAGNFGSYKKFYPAAYPETISVGATDKKDRIASFSNFGKRVDIYAPGEKILSTTLNSEYQVFDGTSESAPIVTAALAYAKLYNKNRKTLIREEGEKPVLDMSLLCLTEEHAAPDKQTNTTIKTKERLTISEKKRISIISMLALMSLCFLIRKKTHHKHFGHLGLLLFLGLASFPNNIFLTQRPTTHAQTTSYGNICNTVTLKSSKEEKSDTICIKENNTETEQKKEHRERKEIEKKKTIPVKVSVTGKGNNEQQNKKAIQQFNNLIKKYSKLAQQEEIGRQRDKVPNKEIYIAKEKENRLQESPNEEKPRTLIVPDGDLIIDQEWPESNALILVPNGTINIISNDSCNKTQNINSILYAKKGIIISKEENRKNCIDKKISIKGIVIGDIQNSSEKSHSEKVQLENNVDIRNNAPPGLTEFLF